MMTKPNPADIQSVSLAAGLTLNDEAAARVANAMGPAFEGFASTAGTLAFDLEPATFVRVQGVGSNS